ncbi:ABC transporter permease [Gorillibacterium massiliense]|uniref:ABC transporter permease n=1 Tax=Gorillibacterium massiliense TaxID=1280390 RepID=UPI0004AD4ED5|nr:ABC transporter permease [Gorillibacterium massiliense]
MNSLLTIIRFTLMNRLRSKSFLVTTVLFALLITIGVNLPNIIDSFTGEGKAVKVGMLQTSSAVPDKLSAHFKKDEKPDVEIVQYPDQGSTTANDAFIREKVDAGEVKGFLVLTENQSAGFPDVVYRSHASFLSGSSTQTKLTQGLQAVKQELAIQGAGLTQEQLKQLYSPLTFKTEMLSQGEGTGGGKDSGMSEDQVAASFILVYALFILMFIVNNLYGNMITMEITSEKSSRVMEILITSVSPVKQMFGKVLGIFILGFGQTLLFIAIAALNLLIPANRVFFDKQNLHFGAVPASFYVYFALFFILGFFLFAMIYASVGSVVSRTEELGQATMPVVLVLLAGFYIGIYGFNDSSSLFVKICSFIPFFSPSVMFMRIGMVGVPLWEIILSLAILLASSLAMGWLAAKIYRTGVLMYGKRPSWKEVIKAMRAYNG